MPTNPYSGGYKKKHKGYPTQEPAPSRQSGGTSGNLFVPGYTPSTPTVPYTPSYSAPSSPSRSAPSPSTPAASSSNPLVVRYLLHRIADVLTPGPTAAEIAQAASTLGVKPKALSAGVSAAVGGVESGVKELAKDVAEGVKAASKLPDHRVVRAFGHKTLGEPTIAEVFRAAQKGITAKAGSGQSAGTARISSRKPDPAGLTINGRGELVTPRARQAVRALRAARKQVGRSGVSLAALHRKYPNLTMETLAAYRAASRRTGVPAPLLAGIEGQESDYGRSDLPGVHSGQNFAGAAGPFQIGNGTGAAGNWWGEHMPAGANIYNDRTAAIGAGRYLTEAGATKDPATWYDAALSYNHADWYAQKAVELAREHMGLSKIGAPANPRAVKDLEAAKNQARQLGISIATQKEAAALGSPSPQVVTRYKAGMAAAKQLEELQLPYVWGGGHNAGQVQLGSGVDCSGAVSYVLQKMGVALPGGVVSGDMGAYLEPGPGAITVFYSPGHTFMRIGDKYFGTSRTNPGGGAGFIDKSVGESEAASGAYQVGHVPGLGRKVALQLGVPTTAPGGAQPFPGMTLSADGSTAVINPGAGQTQGTPGFSAAPLAAVPVSSLLDVHSPLPRAFGEFQLGEQPEEEGPIDEGTIARILRGRRR